MTIPMTREELLELNYPIPGSRDDVRDSLANLISYAPDFVSEHFPDYTIEIGFSMSILGLEELASRSRSESRRVQVRAWIARLLASYAAFKAGDTKRGMSELQPCYWEIKAS